MAFLRTVPRCCTGSKKFSKCLSGVFNASSIDNATRPSVQLVQVLARGYASSAGTTSAQPAAAPRQVDPLDLKFNDPVASFKSKTTMELVRAYIVYQICSIDYLVENNMKVSEKLIYFESNVSERFIGSVTLSSRITW